MMLHAPAALIRRWVVRRWAGTLLRRDLSQQIQTITPRSPVSLTRLSHFPTGAEARRLLTVQGGQRFAQRLADGEVCILANAGDRIVGFGWLGFGKWRLDDVGIAVRIGDAECVLYDLYTLAEARGSLVGSAVVVALLEEAKRRGYQGVYCRVSRHNKASRRLFSRVGFVAGLDLSCVRFLGRFGVYIVRMDNPDGFGKQALQAIEWLGPSILVGKTGAAGRVHIRTSGRTHRLVAQPPLDFSDPKE
jgi:L-amino acid N-acyltransferase YncA